MGNKNQLETTISQAERQKMFEKSRWSSTFENPSYEINTDSSNPKANCKCGSTENIRKVMKINAHWHMDYNNLLQDHRKLESEYWKTKSALAVAEQDRTQLGKKVKQLETTVKKLNSEQESSSAVEMLKLQCTVYQEDFNIEKEEKEKLSRDNLKTKADLKKAYEVISRLSRRRADSNCRSPPPQSANAPY